MGYADISKHRLVKRQASIEAAKKNLKERRDIIRFKVGTVYYRGRSKYVCIKRFNGDKGVVLWFVELSQHRRNMKNFWNESDDLEECFLGYEDELDVDCDDIMLVRCYDGIEYAAEESTVLDMEDRTRPQLGGDGRYDFDDVEEINKDEFEFRADKSCGEEPIDPPDKPPEKHQPKRGKRKSKKGNPILGLILIIGIIILIRACSGS